MSPRTSNSHWFNNDDRKPFSSLIKPLNKCLKAWKKIGGSYDVKEHMHNLQFYYQKEIPDLGMCPVVLNLPS